MPRRVKKRTRLTDLAIWLDSARRAQLAFPFLDTADGSVAKNVCEMASARVSALSAVVRTWRAGTEKNIFKFCGGFPAGIPL